MEILVRILTDETTVHAHMDQINTFVNPTCPASVTLNRNGAASSIEVMLDEGTLDEIASDLLAILYVRVNGRWIQYSGKK